MKKTVDYIGASNGLDPKGYFKGPFFKVRLYVVEDFIEEPIPDEYSIWGSTKDLYGRKEVSDKNITFNLDDLTFIEGNEELSSIRIASFFNARQSQKYLNSNIRSLKNDLKELKKMLIARKLAPNKIDLEALKTITNSVMGEYKPRSFKSDKFLADKKAIFKKAYEELKLLEKIIDPKRIEEEVDTIMDFVISNTVNFIQNNSNLKLSPEQISEIKVLSPSSIMQIEFIEDINVDFVGDYNTAITVNIDYQSKSYNINNADSPVGYGENIDMLYFLSDSREIEEFLVPLAKEYNIEIEKWRSYNEYKFKNISENPLIKFKAIYL
jgi:hypothetical protein